MSIICKLALSGASRNPSVFQSSWNQNYFISPASRYTLGLQVLPPQVSRLLSFPAVPFSYIQESADVLTRLLNYSWPSPRSGTQMALNLNSSTRACTCDSPASIGGDKFWAQSTSLHPDPGAEASLGRSLQSAFLLTGFLAHLLSQSGLDHGFLESSNKGRDLNPSPFPEGKGKRLCRHEDVPSSTQQHAGSTCP